MRRSVPIAAACALTLVMLVADVPQSQQASAVVPGGTNILHVPMSWCIVQGSPAQAAPNIRDELSTVADTNTDAVIWRRHERPTDNIYLPQADISLRSEINNAWGTTFNFPIIADPDTTNGQQGDVNGWNVNTDGVEFTTLINNCDAAYAAPALGRAGIGITAVNVGLFHDNANPANDGNAQLDYVGVIGWGGCNEITPGTCATPFDGRIMVIDNNFLYPTVADRTFPPSPADPGGTLMFTVTDPLDQLVAHEVGHALSLDHRNVTTALMNPTSTDNDGDGRIDNTALNATEIAALRANANNVPGLETDPPGAFVPGRDVSMRVIDGERNDDLRLDLDLASLRVTLDRKLGRVDIGQQLWGLLPCEELRATTYGYLVDLDNDRRTGAQAGLLTKLGLSSDFRGADLIARAKVIGGNEPGPDYSTCTTILAAWVIDGQLIEELPPRAIDVQIQTLRLHPHFAPVSDERILPEDFDADVYNTVNFTVFNRVLPTKLRLDSAFRAQAVVAVRKSPLDQLGKDARGGRFELERPDFPHCFPAGEVAPGETVEVEFDGLLPNMEIHALLGPRLVLEGEKTDENGAGRIDLPIPEDTIPGPHLVTIGHDGLALTADCTVVVQGQ